MQLNDLKCQGLALLFAITLALPGWARALEPRNEFTELLSGLYRRYSWVAVFSVGPPAGKVPLALASKKELSDVFVPDLALAIWNDAQCAKKREICVLDFDILFDSQDPSARDLVIELGKQPTEALVCFKDGDDARRCLTFSGTNINGAFRIADIQYAEGQSLRQLLRLPVRQRTPSTQ